MSFVTFIYLFIIQLALTPYLLFFNVILLFSKQRKLAVILGISLLSIIPTLLIINADFAPVEDISVPITVLINFILISGGIYKLYHFKSEYFPTEVPRLKQYNKLSIGFYGFLVFSYLIASIPIAVMMWHR